MTGAAWCPAWLGLGSNLAQPARQLREALARIEAHPAMRLCQTSRFYRTVPVGGPPDQPMFCNAVAAIKTALTPHELLGELQAMEAAHGRVRDVRWGPRTLDLDLLACGAYRLLGPELQLPHPRAHERGFVLVPLVEIAPDLVLGDGRRAVDCLAGLNTTDVSPWEEGGATCG